MAIYKVPQDVEAEDKLIGPFSFRQFIYLGVAALGIGAGVGLWQIFPGLIIIPLPIVVLFLALALPLRKDQPMETYLVAVIRFFLKPHKRLWQPEGSIALVTIVAPKVAEAPLTKGLGGAAAAAQLGYLAQVVDTQGWATRGVVNPTASMNDIAYAEAQQAEDILDEDMPVARALDTMIDRTNDAYKSTLREQFQQAAQAPAPSNQPAPASQPPTASSQPQQNTTPSPAPDPPTNIDYDPYPDMHQHVIAPAGASHQSSVISNQQRSGAQAVTQKTNDPVITDHRPLVTDHSVQDTSLERVSPDIIRLATNNDLSISAIANEAHRLEERGDEEVVVNLH